mgnify:CR=1 FL=1
MADGASGVKQFAEELGQAAGEVTKDVKDSVGEALEQGVQSVTGTQLTPQQIQQKETERQKKLAENRRIIAHYGKIKQDQKTVRDQEKQKQIQTQQAEIQQQQTKKIQQVKQQAVKIPGQPLREDLARTQVERSKGRGIGG